MTSKSSVFDDWPGVLISKVLFFLIAAMLVASPAFATHFRYGHLTWVPRTDMNPNAVDFTVQSVWRRSAYSTSNGRCIDPATLGSTACSGADGFASVGDLIWEDQGDTKLDPGDGSGLIGGPGSLSNALVYEVTAADVATDWLFGLAVDPAELAVGVVDTAITHTYATAGDYPAELRDCCRIRPCAAPTGHMNNPQDRYDVNTVVNAGAGNSSPVSNLPSVILCPVDGLCEFTVPASDNEVDPLSFRLSTPAEAGFTSQPGPPQCPTAASIDAATGVYSWDTTGCNLASDPKPEPPNGGCNKPSFNTCYSTQVTVEETPAGAGSSSSAVDFFVCLVSCPPSNTSPVFEAPTPTCGSVISAGPGVQTSFFVQAADAETNVSLNVTGLPSGASMTPALPTAGNPVSSSFDWTPTTGDLGQHVVTFEASDGCAPVLCSITIDVSAEDCGDGIDNDGDGLVDCADPDCHGVACADTDGNVCTDAACDAVAGICAQSFFLNAGPCDDGDACTTGDVCGGGACAGTDTSAVDCNDGNGCTDDTCDSVLGCQHANNSATCDDGDACTTGDVCGGGACAGTDTSAVDCNDGNGCTDDTCDSVLGCQHANNSATCDDGLFCNGADTCSGGGCNVHGGDPCAGGSECADACNETLDNCFAAAATSCTNDGLFCTGAEECDGAGSCVSRGTPCVGGGDCADSCDEGADTCFDIVGTVCADDGNACTDDTCDGAGACLHANNTLPCDDGQFCTVNDVCSGGSCAGDPRDCGDGNDCTSDSCDDVGDTCMNDSTATEGLTCDDGKDCTGPDVCAGGICTSVNLPSGTLCEEDGTLCTVEKCDGLGDCVLDRKVSCPVPCAVCDAATGQCMVDPSVPDGTSCDDGRFCTSSDECKDGDCVGDPLGNPQCLSGFKCYWAALKKKFTTITLAVNDEYKGSSTVSIKKSRRVCNPTDIDDLDASNDADLANDGQGAFTNPLAHLRCYKTREEGASSEIAELAIEDRFGKNLYYLNKTKTLCRPAIVTAVQEPDAQIDDPLIPEKVCHGGADNASACAANSDCSSGDCSVSTLDVLTGSYDFKCYRLGRVRGTPRFEKRENLEIADRFEGRERVPNYTKKIEVRKPKIFCAPVGVDGDPIPAGPGLMCYKIKDSKKKRTCDGGSSDMAPCLADSDCPGGICGAPHSQAKFRPVQFESEDILQVPNEQLKAVRGFGLRVSLFCVPSFATFPSPSGAFLDGTAGVLE